MTFWGAGATGNVPLPLGSRAKVLAKQEEAVAGKVGVAPLPPLAWSLRIPARTWERWSQLGWREGQAAQADGPSPCPPVAPLATDRHEKGSLVECACLLPISFAFLSIPHQWTKRLDMEQAPTVPKMQVLYLEVQGQGELTSISIPNKHVGGLRPISSGWEWELQTGGKTPPAFWKGD